MSKQSRKAENGWSSSWEDGWVGSQQFFIVREQNVTKCCTASGLSGFPKTGCECMDWIHLEQVQAQEWNLGNMAVNIYILQKEGNFLIR